MKIIEAMKQIKNLVKKAEDIRGKIKNNASHLSYETPAYADQKGQVSEWIQAHGDILKEILRLRVSIQKTNLATSVTIDLDGKQVTKTIAEWIHRRKDLANLEKSAWDMLTTRGLQEGSGKNSLGQDVEVKIVRCFDQKQKDEVTAKLYSEPMTIDSRLEVVNAITDIIE